MIITVTGEHRVRLAPERAKLFLAVTAEGGSREACVAQATATANELAGELAAFRDTDAVAEFVVEPIRVSAWRERPRTRERVTAHVQLTAVFTDFTVLGGWTAELGSREGVQVGQVLWTLNDETADRLRDACIRGAVDRARTRAEAIARAAGAGEVRIVEVADPGMLGSAEVAAAPAGGFGMMRAAAAMAAPVVEIVPAEIEIGASLQVRFAEGTA